MDAAERQLLLLPSVDLARLVRTPSPPYRGLILKEPTPRFTNGQSSQVLEPHQPVSARKGERRKRATEYPSATASAPPMPRPAPAEIMETKVWHSLCTCSTPGAASGAMYHSKLVRPQSSVTGLQDRNFGRAMISEGFGQYCFAPSSSSEGTAQSASTSRDIALLKNLAEVNRLKARHI
jgi:hypothetical protein